MLTEEVVFVMKKSRFFLCAVGLISLCVALFHACDLGGGGVLGTLYMSDTYNGRVYTYDPNTQTSSTTPLLTTGEGAGDHIYFFNGICYIAVGNNYSNTPGVYAFDPEAVVPVAESIGTSISAQFIMFYNDTKAYVTEADYGASTGVYWFDPSDPDAGLSGPIDSGKINIGEGMYLQDIVASNNKIYVADNGNGGVLVIDPATDTLLKTISTSAGGTTGLLLARGESGEPFVYVANNGGYDSSWNPLPGSIDRIDTRDDTLLQVVPGLSAGHLAYHAQSRKMFAIGYANTYVFSTAGSPPFAVSEVKTRTGASFGGSDILVNDFLLYIASHDFLTRVSTLYVFDTATSSEADHSPLTVGVSGEDGITGLAVR